MSAMREYKMVLLGAGGVGKSALTVQFVQGIFVSKYDPTIEESYRKLVEVDNVTCMLEILDTAGTESFTAMRDLYMKTGQGFILIYSIVAEASFVDLQTTYDHICRVKESNEVPTILVGNKCDLQTQRVIQPEQGKELASKWKNSLFIEASAKTRVNVDEIFTELIRLINKVYPPPAPKKKKGFCVVL